MSLCAASRLHVRVAWCLRTVPTPLNPRTFAPHTAPANARRDVRLVATARVVVIGTTSHSTLGAKRRRPAARPPESPPRSSPEAAGWQQAVACVAPQRRRPQACPPPEHPAPEHIDVLGRHQAQPPRQDPSRLAPIPRSRRHPVPTPTRSAAHPHAERYRRRLPQVRAVLCRRLDRRRPPGPRPAAQPLANRGGRAAPRGPVR